MAPLRIGLFFLVCAFLSEASAGAIPADVKAVHALNRLGYGPRPGDLNRVKAIGIERYLQEQLLPEEIPLPAGLKSRLDGLSTLKLTPVQLFQEYNPQPVLKKDDKEAARLAQQRARIVLEEAAEARILRAVESPRQLQEVMVNFWFNHFNVFAGKGLDRIWVGAYEEQAIRPHALGRFRDLLGATAKHPAMLFYLDNWQNTAPESRGARGRFKGLNENYARELMELHTLGVDGGYTQDDVIVLARILTGWGIRRPRASLSSGAEQGFRSASRTTADGSGFAFDGSRHDSGDKVFLGHRIRGQGIAEGEEALDILARSPATARHIAFRLAQYFIADSPPATIVDRLSKRFLETDGNIRSVMETLVHSPEFWDEKYYAKKFKTPYEFVVSAIRATGSEVRNPRPLMGMMQQLGMPLYGCQTPDGYKNTQEAWLNPNAMTQRISFATLLAGGNPRPGQTLEARNEMRDRAPPANGKEAGVMRSADPSKLLSTLGDRLSAKTKEALAAAPVRLRAAVILGSPDFMHR